MKTGNQQKPAKVAKGIHTHKCCVCFYVYPCTYPKLNLGPVEKCKVTQAAKVNQDGPYCEACRNIEMARRHIEARGGKLVVSIDYSGPSLPSRPSVPK